MTVRPPPPDEGAVLRTRAFLFLAVLTAALLLRALPFLLHGTAEVAEFLERAELRKELLAATAASADAEDRSLDARVEEWINANRESFTARTEQRSEQLRAAYRTRSGDRTYPYLGGMDGYYWLRQARTLLQTGSVCDAVREGECRDTYTHAPLGRRVAYPESLHVRFIAFVHRVAVLLWPDIPLHVSAYVSTAVVGALGLLAVFALGCRFSGGAGGVVAAVLLAASPTFVSRTLGADNDDWNVTLPLVVFFVLLAAARARRRATTFALALLGAAVCAAHAATWDGWRFFYIVFVAALLGALVLQGGRFLRMQRSLQLWRSRRVRTTAFLLCTFYVATGLFTTYTAENTSYVKLPLEFLSVAGYRLSGAPSVAEPESAVPVAIWPSTFGSVRELVARSIDEVAGYRNALWLFALGYFGLALVAVPRARLGPRTLLLAALAAVAGVAAFTLLELAPTRRTAVLGLPIAVVALARLGRDATGEGDIAFLFLTGWFLAAVQLAHQHVRFGLLVAPPVALAASVVVGRLCQTFGTRLPGGRRWLAVAATCVLVLAVVADPVRQGSRQANRYLPQINDAWWKALTHLRTSTPASAVVSTWWDYGYWVKYAADRRVILDGGSLRTHMPHWMARALLAEDERESAGLLRMLNCGSDAASFPEAEQAAFSRLVAADVDEIAAHRMIVEMASMDASTAGEHLARRGVPAAHRDDILGATHCEPPPAYLMLSSSVAGNSAWVYLGDWDFERAYLVDRMRDWPEDRALRFLGDRFEWPEAEALRLYRKALEIDSPDERSAFIAPPAGYLTRTWMPCSTDSAGTLVSCPLDLGVRDSAVSIDAFEYSGGRPDVGALRVRDARSGTVRYQRGRVAEVVLAAADGLSSARPPRASYPMLGVLIDAVEGRVLVGTPRILRSVLTQLAFLDGRYSRIFEKVDARESATGEVVTTWKVHWERLGSSSPPPSSPLRSRPPL